MKLFHFNNIVCADCGVRFENIKDLDSKSGGNAGYLPVFYQNSLIHLKCKKLKEPMFSEIK